MVQFVRELEPWRTTAQHAADFVPAKHRSRRIGDRLRGDRQLKMGRVVLGGRFDGHRDGT